MNITMPRPKPPADIHDHEKASHTNWKSHGTTQVTALPPQRRAKDSEHRKAMQESMAAPTEKEDAPQTNDVTSGLTKVPEMAPIRAPMTHRAGEHRNPRNPERGERHVRITDAHRPMPEIRSAGMAFTSGTRLSTDWALCRVREDP
jgi:hypothetical protein